MREHADSRLIPTIVEQLYLRKVLADPITYAMLLDTVVNNCLSQLWMHTVK